MRSVAVMVAVLSCERTPSTQPEQPAAEASTQAAPVAKSKSRVAEPDVSPRCPEGMALLEPGDTPQELVPFCLDAIEVTVARYRECVDAGTCEPVDPEREWLIEMTWTGDNPELPINYIRYEDALAYCRFRGGRLPTEAEWLWAAGPGRGQGFPWGDTMTWDPPERYCGQYLVSGKEPGQPVPCPAAQYASDRTAEGVYDLVGSLHEYVAPGGNGDYGVANVGVLRGLEPPKPERIGKGPQISAQGSIWRSHEEDELLLGARTSRCARDTRR